MSSTFPDGLTAVGRILSPHGVQGDLKVEPHTWNLERFQSLKDVTLWEPGRLERRTVVAAASLGSGWRLRFEGLDSPESARTLNGLWICVPDSEVVRPTDGGWIEADLVDLPLEDETGERLGVIRGRADLPTDSLLAEDFDGVEIVLPLEGPLAARIELEKGRVVVERETWEAMRA